MKKEKICNIRWYRILQNITLIDDEPNPLPLGKNSTYAREYLHRWIKVDIIRQNRTYSERMKEKRDKKIRLMTALYLIKCLKLIK